MFAEEKAVGEYLRSRLLVCERLQRDFVHAHGWAERSYNRLCR